MNLGSVSIRLNPFKGPDGPSGEPVPWSPYGRMLPERPVFTLDPLFHAGCYYVQDSSAMFVGHLFRQVLHNEMTGIGKESGRSLDCGAAPLKESSESSAPAPPSPTVPPLPGRGRHVPQWHSSPLQSAGRPVRVLDLCAAPGGKTTDLAASLRETCGDNFILIANEVMKSRVGILADNVAIWGDPNVAVTSADPAAFARLQGWFDIIVADVPCSGEGMFRKDPRAVQEWSEDNVALCAARQKRIISDVWPALRSGGYLIYSTCTYETCENDDNLKWASDNLGGEILQPQDEFPAYGVRMTPCGNILKVGEVPGEGQWAGALRKTSAEEDISGKLAARVLEQLRPHRFGLTPGEERNGVLSPDPDWALSLRFEPGRFPGMELDLDTALSFLHREALALPGAAPGLNIVTYLGHPLGWVKNVGRRCNNLHPQGRRIIMDIHRR